jgi:hypothetical protein
VPLPAAHHTGTETDVPSRLKVVMLTKGSLPVRRCPRSEPPSPAQRPSEPYRQRPSRSRPSACPGGGRWLAVGRPYRPATAQPRIPGLAVSGGSPRLMMAEASNSAAKSRPSPHGPGRPNR